MKYFILTIISVLVFTSVAEANGFGLKWDQVVGEYIANVDADSYALTTGEPVRFNFMLWNKDRTEMVDADNVWVKITPEGSRGILFAGQLGKPDFGGLGMSYVFSKSGKYNLSVRFQKADIAGGNTLAEASFPLTVEDVGTESGRGTSRASWGVLGLILGAGIVLTLRKSNRPLLWSSIAILAMAVVFCLVSWFFMNPKSPSSSQSTSAVDSTI